MTADTAVGARRCRVGFGLQRLVGGRSRISHRRSSLRPSVALYDFLAYRSEPFGDRVALTQWRLMANDHAAEKCPHRVDCAKGGHATYAGCGAHLEQARADASATTQYRRGEAERYAPCPQTKIALAAVRVK